MKKIIAVFTAVFMMVSTVHASGVYERLNVELDGMLQFDGCLTYLVDGNAYMNADDMHELLRLSLGEYSYDAVSETYGIQTPNGLYKLKLGDTNATLNNQPFELPLPMIEINGARYLPLKWFAEKFGMELGWDGTTRLVKIAAGRPSVSALAGRPAREPSDEKYRFTFDEALKRIYDNNETLRNMTDQRDDLEEGIDAAQDAYDTLFDSSAPELDISDTATLADLLAGYINGDYAGINPDSTFESVTQRRQINQLKNQLAAMDYNAAIMKDAFRQQLMALLAAEQKMLNQTFLLDKSIALSAENVRIIEVKLNLGMETQANLDAAKISLEQSQSQAESLRIQYDSLQLDINRLLNISQDERIVVEFEISEPESVGIAQLEDHIADLKKNSPYILLEAQKVQEAEYALSTFDSMPEEVAEGSEDRGTLSTALASAKRNFTSQQAQLEKNIRASYLELMALEESYRTMTLDQTSVKADFRLLQTNYLIEQVTAYDLRQAELMLLQQEIALDDYKTDYWLAEYSYLHPNI